jgi:nucleotide-binding universal stress UspA family protein
MNVLIAVKGSETEAYFRQVAVLLPPGERQRLVLAHVVDAGPRAGMEMGRQHRLSGRGLGEDRLSALTQAEEDRARSALQFGRQALMAAGLDDGHMEEIVLRGRPNEELLHLAEAEGIDLIVVGGRKEKLGPHSIGKTARFLIDHAPHAALMVRA